MRVADVMSRDVISISLDATLLDAAVRLADSHVSGLAVVDERTRLVGVITASDILGAEAEAEAEDDGGQGADEQGPIGIFGRPDKGGVSSGTDRHRPGPHRQIAWWVEQHGLRIEVEEREGA